MCIARRTMAEKVQHQTTLLLGAHTFVVALAVVSALRQVYHVLFGSQRLGTDSSPIVPIVEAESRVSCVQEPPCDKSGGH